MRQHASTLTAFHRLADCIIVALSLFLACSLYDVAVDMKYWFAATLGASVFAFAGEFSRLYRSWRIFSLRQEAMELLFVFGIVIIIHHHRNIPFCVLRH